MNFINKLSRFIYNLSYPNFIGKRISRERLFNLITINFCVEDIDRIVLNDDYYVIIPDDIIRRVYGIYNDPHKYKVNQYDCTYKSVRAWAWVREHFGGNPAFGQVIIPQLPKPHQMNVRLSESYKFYLVEMQNKPVSEKEIELLTKINFLEM